MLKSIHAILFVFGIVPILILRINGSKICTTQSCISIADQIAGFMDLAADPCEDFNQFSCGGYVKNAMASNSYGSPWGDSAAQMEDRIERLIKTKTGRITDFEVDKKVRDFYNGCEKFRNQLQTHPNADKTKLRKLATDFKNTLDNIGLAGWPYSKDSVGMEDFRWHDVVPKMIEEGLVFTDGRIELPIINVDVGVNDLTKTENILKIDSPDMDIFVSDGKTIKGDINYFMDVHYTRPKAIMKIMSPTIDFSSQLVLNRSIEITEGLVQIINLHTATHRLLKTEKEYGFQESNYKETTVSNLPPLSCGTTSVVCKPPTWDEYLNSLFHASGNPAVRIDGTQTLFVIDPKYIDQLNSKLNSLKQNLLSLPILQTFGSISRK